MAFKFRDLIVTVVPRPDLGFGEGASGGTVGSCTSECGGGGGFLNCGVSDEVLNPLQALIDPAYLVDLRLLLRLGIATTLAGRVAALEANMLPRTIEEVDLLEKHLTNALSELGQVRKRLQEAKGG